MDRNDSRQDDDETRRQLLFCILEMCFCVALLVVALVVEFVAMPQHMRAIPVQIIITNANTVEGSNNTEEASRFYIRNLQYNEEEKEETVGTAVLALVGLVLPFLLQLAVTSFIKKWKRPFDRYNTICSYFMAVALTFLVIDVTKLYCGYLRPNFYDVCQPDETYTTCTNTDDSDERGIRDSFPSGHAGLALAGLGSLSLFVHHRCGVGSVPLEKANIGDHQIARLWSFLAVIPVLLALFMGVSRIHDNQHHPSDVVGGAAIGGVIAYFCHHVWFLE